MQKNLQGKQDMIMNTGLGTLNQFVSDQFKMFKHNDNAILLEGDDMMEHMPEKS